MIGVPIILDYHTLGILAVHLAFSSKRDYNSALKFLTLVASALLQPIRVKHVIANERQKLMNENVILKQKLRANTTVMLRGESGTGKELIAEAIHYNSLRSQNPFILVNCAAVPENLIESEFFGYERGAFTGAVVSKKGRFQLADKGTIFLDEVGELSPATQVKLLRVLQEQTFERVGGTESIRVDVRVIAATNADLEELMAKGKFREDLYYRLNVFSIYLPPTLQTAESSDTMPRLSLTGAVQAYEKELIQDALKSSLGNKARAARLLDTTERIIGYKIDKYEIDVQRFMG